MRWTSTQCLFYFAVRSVQTVGQWLSGRPVCDCTTEMREEMKRMEIWMIMDRITMMINNQEDQMRRTTHCKVDGETISQEISIMTNSTIGIKCHQEIVPMIIDYCDRVYDYRYLVCLYRM